MTAEKYPVTEERIRKAIEMLRIQGYRDPEPTIYGIHTGWTPVDRFACIDDSDDLTEFAQLVRALDMAKCPRCKCKFDPRPVIRHTHLSHVPVFRAVCLECGVFFQQGGCASMMLSRANTLFVDLDLSDYVKVKSNHTEEIVPFHYLHRELFCDEEY